MPETPDCNAIALRVLVDLDQFPPLNERDTAATRQALAIVAEQLRLVWNARGAADLAELEAVSAGASPSMKVIDQILRALDR
jgi:hypothetical protein